MTPETETRAIQRIRAPSYKAVARRLNVKALWVRGYTVDEIAARMKCSHSTAARDLAELKADPAFKLGAAAAQEALQRILMALGDLVDRARAIADDKDQPATVRLKGIGHIGAQLYRMAKVQLDYLKPGGIGIIAEPGSMVQVNMTRQDLAVVLVDLLEGVPEEWQRFILDKAKTLEVEANGQGPLG
jgi:hypothetical protein